ncbi:leucyl aminopeptidase [Ureibacillus sp. FSL K6-8385]|uniref:Probable cytosol aminopeptidase n=2 Tax=Bacillati TaxID=1783272 RepID=A0A540V0F4_9BACL|nr:leucyl aminopeptidase [Ureibacillus terrenus]MED3662411.1 leucyl aminopeptidase [Ureibacillus terrenus]MED3763769.1 leucyl aminopeptidase [Ureibacillus terrenus]TQE90250.1 leucyl aminopeptidase [Ureibacillus terrenus]
MIRKEKISFAQIPTELLIVGVQKNCDHIQGWKDFVSFYGEQVEKWIRTGDIDTDRKKLTRIPFIGTHDHLQRVLFVGLGDPKTLTRNELRETFGLVGKQLREMRANKFTIWLESFTAAPIHEKDAAFLFGEGCGMGFYQVPHYKTTSNVPDVHLDEVYFVTDEDVDEIAESYKWGSVYAEAVNEARTLVNLPPNILRAADLADYAVDLAHQYGFEVEILNKAQIEELGMGGILAVNRGSTNEPRVITLKYKGTDEWKNVIGLVGKGVTYDTGGYSIKSKTGMVGMKGDMGGAAAVLGAMKIIGERKPKKNVVAVIGATDNMISGDAFKPDDVITTYSGKTVEIKNADAEGRLILADAVTYAKQHGANYLIDVATLTGGVITALGYDKTGALTNHEGFFDKFMEASIKTGEFVWGMPLTERDRKRIRDSQIADLNNSPGSDGHMIFAGGFVGEFVEKTPWIHLDIAGTSDASKPYDLGPKGGTGVMVRTLATFVEDFAFNIV